MKNGSSFMLALGTNHGPSDLENLIRYYPGENFPAISIAEELLDESPQLVNELGKHRIPRYHFFQKEGARVTRRITEQPQKFADDFLINTLSLLKRLSRFPCDSLSLDFSLDACLKDEDRKRSLLRLLKLSTRSCIDYGICLALPLRIPFEYDTIAEDALTLVQESMNPKVKFEIDIHSHDIGGEFKPEKLLRWLKLDLKIVRFFYEPEVGNHLVPKLVIPWIDYLRTIAFDGLVVFSPYANSSDMFLKEADNITNILKKPPLDAT